ncbi:MAG: signal peptidase II [Clostridia bacterium]|nr:signal peptidase II [Clostridia bacterium]
MYIWIILMLLGVFLDQISKYLIVLYMELYQSVEVIPGVFNFTYIQNEGAAFGSMSNSPWVFMVLSTVMIVGILVYMFWKKPQSRLLLSALTMIVAGGIGNMIDRIRLGYVIDFLDFCAFPKLWKWTFNVADSFVVIGAGMIILWMILDMVREYKAEKAKKLAQGQDEQTAEKTVPDEAASEVTEPVQDNTEEVNAEDGNSQEDNANE